MSSFSSVTDKQSEQIRIESSNQPPPISSGSSRRFMPSSRASLKSVPDSEPSHLLKRSDSFTDLLGVPVTVAQARMILQPGGSRPIGRGKEKLVWGPNYKASVYGIEKDFPNRALCNAKEPTPEKNIEFYAFEKLSDTLLERSPDILPRTKAYTVRTSTAVWPGKAFSSYERYKTSAADLIDHGKLKPLSKYSVVDLLTKVSKVHKAGILLRDIKPANLLINNGEFVETPPRLPICNALLKLVSQSREQDPSENTPIFEPCDFDYATSIDESAKEEAIQKVLNSKELKLTIDLKIQEAKQSAESAPDTGGLEEDDGVNSFEAEKEEVTRKLRKQTAQNAQLGTYEYTSKNLNGSSYEFKPKDDLYSLAITLLELALGRIALDAGNRPGDGASKTEKVSYFEGCFKQIKEDVLGDDQLKNIYGQLINPAFKEFIGEMMDNIEASNPKSADDFIEQLQNLQGDIYMNGTDSPNCFRIWV